MSAVGIMPLRPVPPADVFALKLVPIALSFAATLYSGNLAYLSLSVAFIQILKVQP